MKIKGWKLIPLLVFMLLTGFLWRGLSLNPRALPSVQVGKALPNFQLPLLNQTQQQFSVKSLQGHIVLLNVWASWCSSCSDEQAFLLTLANQIPIYGLNYKDSPKEATQWLHDWGNPYKAVAEDAQGKVAIDLGVYGTPETFLIDQHGIIRHRHAGELTAQIWNREFAPLLQQLQKGA